MPSESGIPEPFRAFLTDRPEMKDNTCWMTVDGKEEFMLDYEGMKAFSLWAEENGCVDPTTPRRC